MTVNEKEYEIIKEACDMLSSLEDKPVPSPVVVALSWMIMGAKVER